MITERIIDRNNQLKTEIERCEKDNIERKATDETSGNDQIGARGQARVSKRDGNRQTEPENRQ